ncbi:MAG: hypothetical protein AVDCRST_MAG30-1439, partial [uncultured Solirubrobacteraceae bacterium]
DDRPARGAHRALGADAALLRGRGRAARVGAQRGGIPALRAGRRRARSARAHAARARRGAGRRQARAELRGVAGRRRGGARARPRRPDPDAAPAARRAGRRCPIHRRRGAGAHDQPDQPDRRGGPPHRRRLPRRGLRRRCERRRRQAADGRPRAARRADGRAGLGLGGARRAPTRPRLRRVQPANGAARPRGGAGARSRAVRGRPGRRRAGGRGGARRRRSRVGRGAGRDRAPGGPVAGRGRGPREGGGADRGLHGSSRRALLDARGHRQRLAAGADARARRDGRRLGVVRPRPAGARL